MFGDMASKQWVANNQDRLKAYRRAYYSRNSESERARISARAAAIVEWFADLKAALKCARCQESHPACLEFHHRDPDAKEGGIAKMVQDGYCREAILTEIAKCDVLCSNCHRKLHYEIRYASDVTEA